MNDSRFLPLSAFIFVETINTTPIHIFIHSIPQKEIKKIVSLSKVRIGTSIVIAKSQSESKVRCAVS
ncbi:hypothetical protein RIF29_27137 [Crotalaria pallida]|uniref:Uncharacterized protein n=1 Tax=Crotalaria pallida TaxID=3830 RepID=A0AAN9EPH9_CROPI